MTRPDESFDYESSIWGEERVLPGDRTIAGYTLAVALAHLPPRGSVLEIGCGAGRFLRGLASSSPQLALTGADVSRNALRRAAELSAGLDLHLYPSPDSRIPAEDAAFDAVLALDVLEHLADPVRMLDEAWRVLKEGGVFHLHVPCEGDPLCLWRWLPGQRGTRGLKRRFGGHIQRFRRAEVRALLARAGFEIVEVRYSLHLLGNLADVGAFLAIWWLNRRPTPTPATTGSILAGADGARRSSLLGRLVRTVNRSLWAEARLLGRVPSWSLHVTARKTSGASAPRGSEGTE